MYFPLLLICLIHGSNTSGFQYAFDIRMMPPVQNLPSSLCGNLAAFMDQLVNQEQDWERGRVAYERYRLVGTEWTVELGEIRLIDDIARMFFYPEQICKDLHLPLFTGEPFDPVMFRHRFVGTCESMSGNIERLRIVSDMHNEHPEREEQLTAFAFRDLESLVMKPYKDYVGIIFDKQASPCQICSNLPISFHPS